MPSVRVRRGSQVYTSLFGEENDEQQHDEDRPDLRRPRSTTLANAFRPGTSPPRPAPPSPPPTSPDSAAARSVYLEPPPRDMSPGATARRKYDSLRAKPSRIAESILSNRLSHRYLRGRAGSNARSPSVDSNPSHERRSITLEGSQADVVISTDGHPGFIGSSLSVSSSRPDSYDGSSTDVLHHEDEIVEHLDVIDPQVATISNLANAANSILIPPIGVYSRKPVVVLPRMPATRTDKDGEKGEGIHEDDLDRHVEDVLSRQSKWKRRMKGVWAFMKTPMGIVASVYGFLVVFWGTAIVLFLLKWINLHDSVNQGFWVEVTCQIENALFTITGVGLFPWRVIDTYRIIKIWQYKKLTRRLRKKAGLPKLYDEDDLPDPMYDPNYVHVLTDKQQKDLHYQQQQFMNSQTWYRAHGTPTHRAFPITTALLICLFVDGNSAFQVILCGCMWGLNRFQRPAWTTGTLIPATFLCGIISAVFILRGGQKTKRTKEVEERLRMALTLERNPSKLKVVQDQIVRADSEGRMVSAPVTPPAVPEKDEQTERSPNRRRVSGDSLKAEAGTDVDPNRDTIFIEEKMVIPHSV